MHPGVYTNRTWESPSGAFFSSYNPASNKGLWEGHAASEQDVDIAIQNARKAFKNWSNQTTNERSQYLNRFAEIVEEKQAFLAKIISEETGKPLWDSKTEVSSVINKITISLKSYGMRSAGMMKELTNGRSITRHKPHGVVGVMGPFNFPAHLSNSHIVPALLAGNTVIFKPSELTPLVAEEIVKCWHEADLPEGVLNLIQGGHETGQALVQNPDINGLFFTGSSQTGLLIFKLFCAHPGKILALEMGGNNPLVISHVSNLEAAVYLTIQSAYLSSGQRCTCARRLIVLNDQKGDAFIQRLIDQIRHIIVGEYTQTPEPYMGPLIRESHALKVLESQEYLASQGGIPLIKVDFLRKGTGFLNPGLMDVTKVKNRPDEEIFGPFLQLIRVHTFEEAIEEANHTKYGLVAGLISDNFSEYDLFYKQIRAGLINWNTPLTGASSTAPFGGIGYSGNHRPSAYYAADYCSYPVASLEMPEMTLPLHLPPGFKGV